MTIPLLTTKFHIPAVRSQLISRPHLLQRLNAGLQPGQRLSLISAPLGFGKTTLLSEWLASGPVRTYSTSRRSPRYAWLTLDDGDNDLGRFIRYLIGALQTVDAELGRTALALLRTPLSAEESFSIEAVLTALINDWSDRAETLGVILDDYQLITTPAVHEAVTFLIDHLPFAGRVTIAGRTDPPLALARWRASNQLIELRTADLRFTPEETAAFVNQVMGLHLSADEVTALDKRTEGWIAGLQLAALSMQGRSDAASFIATLAGNNRYILDYLVEEVLQRQSAEVQHFLARTSILERLTGSLCDALTGGADGQARLERLEQANLFILPLDHERLWYRYHPLFAEFLRARLRQVTGSSVTQLHLRASEWYAQHQLPVEAITHALQADEFERAAQLIEPLTRDWLFVYNESGLLFSWLQAVPDPVLRRWPRLWLAHAWISLIKGQHAAAEAQLRSIETDDVSLQGEITAAQTLLAVIHGDVPRTIELAQQALDQLAVDESFLRGLVALNLGLAYDQIGNIEAASRAYTQAGTLGQDTGNALVVLIAAVQLADLTALQGQLPQAAELYQRAIERAKKAGQMPQMISMVDASWGRLLYEWNDLDGAARVFTDCIELGRHWASSDMTLTGLVFLAHVKHAQGEVATSREIMRQAEEAMHEHMVSPPTVTVAKAYQARLQLQQGSIEAAQQWTREYQTRRSQPTSIFLHEIEELTLARSYMAQGQLDQAQAVLDPILATAQTMGRVAILIETQVLRAIVYEAQGNSSEAIETIQEALTQAAPGGYLRTFVDVGVILKTVLIKVAARDQTRAARLPYAEKVLAAFGQRQPPSTSNTRSAALVEPLSDRELQVLRLIAEGLSNQEIAAQLIIAPSTIKTHINNIYGKLGAQSRTRAVARARELNLV